MFVATVKTIAPWGDIREYAVKLFEKQGLGERGKDNGLLVLLAVQERRVWMEVGYGLEQYITDGFAGETSRQVMTPFFRQGDYGGGLEAGVARLVGRIAEARQDRNHGRTAARRRRDTRHRCRRTRCSSCSCWCSWASAGCRPSTGSGSRGGDGGAAAAWSGWNSGVGPFGGGGFGGGFGGFGGGGGGGGGFGGFGGGRSGGGGGGASW